mmetsp:Transcript_13985/g.52229  ORF Transcript_13985/g.52229 Transcript_13985/m.52229 type:complete len:200 (+) Transcript_13985:1122-1721(+)
MAEVLGQHLSFESLGILDFEGSPILHEAHDVAVLVVHHLVQLPHEAGDGASLVVVVIAAVVAVVAVVVAGAAASATAAAASAAVVPVPESVLVLVSRRGARRVLADLDVLLYFASEHALAVRHPRVHSRHVDRVRRGSQRTSSVLATRGTRVFKFFFKRSSRACEAPPALEARLAGLQACLRTSLRPCEGLESEQTLQS